MKPDKLLARIHSGGVANVRFRDAQRLVVALGFELIEIKGSHHIYGRPGTPEQINLQSVKGQAKPYQLKQILVLVERHQLPL